MGIFGFLAGPLGWLLKLVYDFVNNYFLAILLFTLITRIILFPFSLQSQKKQADRIRLAPRLERLQKKYKNDPRKLQEKQQALYEKEGVSLTGGCGPMIIQMIVLFGIIAVIYSPLTYLSNVEDSAINNAITAVGVGDRGYYKEMNMLSKLETDEDTIRASLLESYEGNQAKADAAYAEFKQMRAQFQFGNRTLLANPWTEKGFGDINILWLIPLLSGLTAIASSVLSLHYSKQGMSQEKQPGQGCSNTMMFLFMPLFSLYITFTVPAGVGIYWTCSNLIAILQTWILNVIYNPKKIREQAEIDYQERRKKRAEMKKQTLADARRLDDAREKAEDEAAAAVANEPQEKKSKKEKTLELEVGELKPDENDG